MIDDDRAALLDEIRYAERLCQRTARLYRRVQVVSVFLSVLGGSATLAALAPTAPAAISAAGAATLAVFGALALAVRPADKAAANEADAKRYARLRTQASGMSAAELSAALAAAHEGDAPEIEALRDVAYNDVAAEIGRADAAVPLRLHQRVLAALA